MVRLWISDQWRRIIHGMDDVREAIKSLRSSGWTVATIAEAVGVDPSSVARWEAGRRSPENVKGVLLILEGLAKRKRVPKRRRAASGTREQEKPPSITVTPDVATYRCKLCGYRWDLPKRLPVPVTCPRCNFRGGVVRRS
jgi:transcriptional regulator with XRE-family HTH domain